MKSKYKCSGKVYAGEKAIISLTSWKKRIGTVSKTLYSLIKQCPGFHIVLVLSEEEFPRMEQELPPDLLVFVQHRLIEILWVYRNYKSFKKVLFTMDKYKSVPVISADDDCIYSYNYAEELYQKYRVLRCIVANSGSFGSGYGIIFPPNSFPNFKKHLTNKIIKTNHDDFFYKFLIQENNCRYISLHTRAICREFVIFHDDVSSITEMSNPYEKKNESIFESEFGFKLNWASK